MKPSEFVCPGCVLCKNDAGYWCRRNKQAETNAAQAFAERDAARARVAELEGLLRAVQRDGLMGDIQFDIDAALAPQPEREKP